MSLSNRAIAGDMLDGVTLPFPLTVIDREVLSQSDEEFQPHSWEELKEIVAQNSLEKLKRWPSHLRRYIFWTVEIRKKHGGITNYVCSMKLFWQPIAQDDPRRG